MRSSAAVPVAPPPADCLEAALMIATNTGSELLAVFIAMVCSLGVLAVPLLFLLALLGAMVVLPFRWRATWARWTSAGVARAWENVAEGSTTGLVQFRPASYLHERTVAKLPTTPAQTRAGLLATYTTPLAMILAQDEDGVVVDLRLPSGLGPGWIAVFKVLPDGEGSQVLARLRSTLCLPFPVLTPFLALTWHLHLDRIVRAAAARGA